MKWLLCFILVAAIVQHECRRMRNDDLPFSTTRPGFDPSHQCAQNAGFIKSVPPNPFNFEHTDINTINQRDKDYRKFVYCLWVTLGVVKMNGRVDGKYFNIFRRQVQEENHLELETLAIRMEPCKHIYELSPEATSVKLNKCFVLAMQELVSCKKNSITSTIPSVGVNPARQCADVLAISQETMPNPFNSENVRAVNETDEDYRRFILCVWLKVGVVKRDGTIIEKDFELFLQAIFGETPDEMVLISSSMEPCKKIKQYNAEDTAVKLNECYLSVMDGLRPKQKNPTTSTTPRTRFSPARHCADSLKLRQIAFPSPFNFDGDNVVDENDKNYREFILCLWTKVEVVQKDGTINEREFDFFLQEVFGGTSEEMALVSNNMKPCKKIKEDTGEEAAVKLNECYLLVLEKLQSVEKDPTTSTISTTGFNPARQCAETFKLHQTAFPSPLNLDCDNILDEDDKNYRQFILCLWSAMGVVRIDGRINRRAFHYFLLGAFEGTPKEMNFLFDIMESCKGIKGNNAEETAVKLNKCYLLAMKELKKSQQKEKKEEVPLNAEIWVVSPHADNETNAAVWCMEILALHKSSLPTSYDDVVHAGRLKEFRKFVHCFWSKQGVVKRDGTINGERLDYTVREMLEDTPKTADVLINMMESCKTIKEKTAQEAAVKLYQCYAFHVQRFKEEAMKIEK